MATDRLRPSWRCWMGWHRRRLTYTREACVLRCRDCEHDLVTGPVLRPEVRRQVARESAAATLAAATLAADRERRLAEMRARLASV